MEKTLIEKLSMIASEAGNIKKNGWNSHQMYKYLKIDDIYDHFSKVMSLHNVVFSTTIKNYQIIDRLVHGVVVGEFKSVNETFLCEVGTAATVNDKMMRNFMQNAVKQIFLQVFLISSGDPDPDGEPEAKIEPAAKPVSKPVVKPVAKLQTLVIPDEKWDVKKFVEIIVKMDHTTRIAEVLNKKTGEVVKYCLTPKQEAEYKNYIDQLFNE